MDETDLAILREMFTDRVFRLGGADPRISHSQIATRLRLPKSTVTQRIRNWVESGFYRGSMIFPNPPVLGLRLFGQTVAVDSASLRDQVIGRLRDVPGTAFVYEAATALDFWLGYLGDSPEVVKRGKEILCQHPGVKATDETYEFPLPECAFEPTNLDWRIVRALRATPDGPLGEVAASLGVGYRTFTSRFDRMIRSRALLYAPRLDFTRARGTIVETELHLNPGANVEEIWANVDRAYPLVLRLYPWSDPSGLWPYTESAISTDYPTWGPCLQFYSCSRSPGESLRTRSTAERWPGVQRVETNFLVSLWDVPDPFDSIIEARIRDSEKERRKA